MSRLEENTADLALGHTGDGAFAVGSDGRIVLWNRAAERMLGHSSREALGKSCCELFGGSDGHGNRLCYQGCHVMTLVKMGEPVKNFDMRSRTKTGQPLWLNVSTLARNGRVNGNGHENSIGHRSGNAHTHGNGDSTLMVHFFRDVTASKELLGMVQERLAPPVPRDEAMEPIGTLTRRELEVLRLLGTGANTKAAADRLHVSPATIRNHVQNIFGKIGVHSRLEAVAYATRHRLL